MSINIWKFCAIWLQKIQQFLLPTYCILCHANCPTPLALCAGCRADLPWLSHACIQCGVPLPEEADTPFCGACLFTPPPFEHTVALFHYQSPLDRLITGLKFHNRLINSRILGCLMAEQLHLHLQNHAKPELIIPVPLHKSRLRKRGFNQALEIARYISTQLHIKVRPSLCQRKRHTQPQSQLPATLRRNNVKGAFSIRKSLQVKHVAIVDDVVTTGNTITELAKVLKQNGVEIIEVWCVARTQLNK